MRWVHWAAVCASGFIFGMALDGVTSLGTIALMMAMFFVVVVAVFTSPTREDRRKRSDRTRVTRTR